MKTLIIHPNDGSTSFLDIVYNDVPNKTVITKNAPRENLIYLMKTHDRVMMMGHGSPRGLFSVGAFRGKLGMVIDQEFVKILKEKDNSVFIWCNADKFVEKYNLRGFYTGMFVSEVGEAMYCGLSSFVNQDDVDESNLGFCNIMAQAINEDQEVLHEHVKKWYGRMATWNEVAEYNCDRLYLNNNNSSITFQKGVTA